MNKDNAPDYLPLVQALAEGKTIQVREFWGGEWTVINHTNFTYPPEHYRIKPEPREFWLDTEHLKAYLYCKPEDDRYCIKVREVLDDE